MKKALLILVFLLANSAGFAGKTIELEVFRDWRGSECNFKSSRPFFLIKDIYDLEKFWAQANADEGMPFFDFDKYMLLVWNPGPSLFDHHPVKVERFTYRDGRFFILMDLQKKHSGGFWRRPFVATLLPRIKEGDIFVMRKVEQPGKKPVWRHIYTIWDMSPGRNMPFEVVKKIEEPDNRPRFIDPKRHPKDQESSLALLPRPTQKPTASQNTGLSGWTTQRQEPAAQQPVAAAKTEAPKSKEKEKEEEEEEEDFFPDFGTSSAQSQASAKSGKAGAEKKPQPKVKPPAFDEDPLFGEEFDINF
jgi:hypothetical protein